MQGDIALRAEPLTSLADLLFGTTIGYMADTVQVALRPKVPIHSLTMFQLSFVLINLSFDPA